MSPDAAAVDPTLLQALIEKWRLAANAVARRSDGGNPEVAILISTRIQTFVECADELSEALAQAEAQGARQTKDDNDDDEG